MSHSNPQISQAAAVLALINSSPRTPTQEAIAAIIAKTVSAPQQLPKPKLVTDIRAKIAELRAAYAVQGHLHDGPEFDAAEAKVDALKVDLDALEAEIPSPPQSPADIAMRADVALFWSAEETVEALKSDVDDELTVRLGRLIEAAQQLAERNVAVVYGPEEPGDGDLPFMRRKPDGTPVFWVVEPTGDWGHDSEVGAEHARSYLSCQPQPLLSFIVADMIARGRYTGVEAGFLSYIGRLAESANWAMARGILFDQR
jgi:hypothetical protein